MAVIQILTIYIWFHIYVAFSFNTNYADETIAKFVNNLRNRYTRAISSVDEMDRRERESRAQPPLQNEREWQ